MCRIQYSIGKQKDVATPAIVFVINSSSAIPFYPRLTALQDRLGTKKHPNHAFQFESIKMNLHLVQTKWFLQRFKED